MKKFYFATALAAFALASCTSDDIGFNTAQDVIEAQQSNAIQFGTYMGNTPVTRAGQAGSINDNVLKGLGTNGTGTWSEEESKKYGFGVFAFYTEDKTYGQFQGGTYTGETGKADNNSAANFMFNEQIWWNQTNKNANYVTGWTYAPVKYWPNEFANGAVDDADNDQNNNQATGAAAKGNVSFFAYAPYVSLPITATASGIVAINGKTDASANAFEGDPTVKYIVATSGTDIVDLLWGTYGSKTGKNVFGTGNAGVAFDNSAAANTYKKAILPHQTSATPTPTYDGYKLNADLTKQKTDGTVEFAFKHALAKVGGSEVYSTLTGGTTHGLMVVLDIDDMKGAEKGGTFNKSETKVTVSNITIKAKALVKDGSNNKPGDTGYTKTYLKKQEGTLNLATGVWTLNTEASNKTATVGEAAETTHTINTAGSNGKLNTTIAEPTPAPAHTTDGWNGLPEGVLTAAKNVYESEAAPLVFIPGTYPELTITITYLVRTVDNKLAGAYSQVSQTISKVVSFSEAVELNKQYNLLLHLGLTGVKFTATVSDWEVNGDTNGNGTIDATETLVVTDTDLPINVGAATSTSVKAGTTATTYTAADNTTFAINLYGLTNGNTIQCTNVSGGGIASTSAVTLTPGTIDASGNATATVSLTANSTAATVDNTVTIVEKNGSNVVSTTIVKITQLKAVTP